MKTAVKRKQSRPRRKECKECAELRGKVSILRETGACKDGIIDRNAIVMDRLFAETCKAGAMLNSLSHALERANDRIECAMGSISYWKALSNKEREAPLQAETDSINSDSALATYVSDFQSKKAALDKLLFLLTTHVYRGVFARVIYPTDWKAILWCMNELAPKGVRTT